VNEVSLVPVFNRVPRLYPRQYHSSNAPYSFINLPPMPYIYSDWQRH